LPLCGLEQRFAPLRHLSSEQIIMAVILASTASGCRTFTDSGNATIELAGRKVSALAAEAGGTCLAVVDGQEIWRRSNHGEWSQVTTTGIPLQSIASVDGIIVAGGMEEAAVIRISKRNEAERLNGFDNISGREEWFAGGPPLGVRSLTATADGAAILAAVHVGGIPRSSDGGETWTATIPVMWDVHEVTAHPSRANIVTAAAAVGLCMSYDQGRNWTVLSEDFAGKTSLALACLENEILFSLQDSPFAKQSRVWRWRMDDQHIELVRDGLPEWLDGKVDTAHIAAFAGRAAICDGGGNLWLSASGSRGWQRIAAGLPYIFSLVIF
jgi:hypothetical protein